MRERISSANSYSGRPSRLLRARTMALGAPLHGHSNRRGPGSFHLWMGRFWASFSGPLKAPGRGGFPKMGRISTKVGVHVNQTDIVLAYVLTDWLEGMRSCAQRAQSIVHSNAIANDVASIGLWAAGVQPPLHKRITGPAPPGG